MWSNKEKALGLEKGEKFVSSLKFLFTEGKVENQLRVFAIIFFSSKIMILNPNFQQDTGKFRLIRLISGVV